MLNANVDSAIPTSSRRRVAISSAVDPVPIPERAHPRYIPTPAGPLMPPTSSVPHQCPRRCPTQLQRSRASLRPGPARFGPGLEPDRKNVSRAVTALSPISRLRSVAMSFRHLARFWDSVVRANVTQRRPWASYVLCCHCQMDRTRDRRARAVKSGHPSFSCDYQGCVLL